MRAGRIVVGRAGAATFEIEDIALHRDQPVPPCSTSQCGTDQPLRCGAMNIDEDVRVDDEGGGEIDGATHARSNLSARKRRTSSRKARSSGLSERSEHVSEGLFK